MFWKTSEPHGLPRNPFKSCVIPRPIGWISTISKNSILNLAPYSFFNGISDDPPMVMFSSGGSGFDSEDNEKDTITNAEETGEFVCAMVSQELTAAMNESSASVSARVDEFNLAGLETAPSELVKPPRIKTAPIHLECTYYDTIELPRGSTGRGNRVCMGNVIGVHISDTVMKDGFVDVMSFKPMARLGYMDYTTVDNVLTLLRPGMKG
tara:strand:+ start:1417 stop:2043 length:627 start_codon:yes stop_codon:yes gene_type:complete